MANPALTELPPFTLLDEPDLAFESRRLGRRALSIVVAI